MAIDPVREYAQGVLNGKYPAGYLVVAACKRHLNDLKRSRKKDFPYRFDSKKAIRAIKFCGLLKHYKGKCRGKSFIPMPFQCFILGSVFGWVRKVSALRRFRECYAEIARKNGKTFLGGAIGLFCLVADNEGAPEVYATATKLDQAKLVWGDACKMTKHSASLRKHLTEKYSRLYFDALDGVFAPLAADSKTLDGLNPSAAINDEYHKHPDSSLYDVIKDGMGAREQPLLCTITTAGDSHTSACYELHNHCVNVLTTEGYDDEEIFIYISSPDPEDLEGDGWMRPEVWYKANPALGEAKTEEWMESEVAQAKLRPSREYAFKNMQLNIWTATNEKWLNMSRWDNCAGEVEEETLKSRRCFVGLDLSSKYDFSCAALVFPPGPYPEWAVLPRFYYPEENIRERAREMRVPLEQWMKEGLIIPTPGDMIDLEFILEDLRGLSKLYEIAEIGFDPWKAIELATKLEQDGFDMVQMRQGHGTLGAPTSELESKMMKGQIRHGGNPILRWMAGNTMVRRDPNDNIVPDKQKSAQKIDGIVATIMGLGRGMVSVGDGKSVYEERGVRTL